MHTGNSFTSTAAVSSEGSREMSESVEISAHLEPVSWFNWATFAEIATLVIISLFLIRRRRDARAILMFGIAVVLLALEIAWVPLLGVSIEGPMMMAPIILGYTSSALMIVWIVMLYKCILK
jgi:hypothetical protein